LVTAFVSPYKTRLIKRSLRFDRHPLFIITPALTVLEERDSGQVIR
jgi:hypothetical protein